MARLLVQGRWGLLPNAHALCRGGTWPCPASSSLSSAATTTATPGGNVSSSPSSQPDSRVRPRLKDVPGIKEFMRAAASTLPASSPAPVLEEPAKRVPYLSPSHSDGTGRRVFFETYGCQVGTQAGGRAGPFCLCLWVWRAVLVCVFKPLSTPTAALLPHSSDECQRRGDSVVHPPVQRL